MASYAVKDRIYAYRFIVSLFGLYKGNDQIERRVPVGLVTIFNYFDEDGDGKFETQYLTTEMPKHIPNWVKNLK
jgi:hypothetical protein